MASSPSEARTNKLTPAHGGGFPAGPEPGPPPGRRMPGWKWFLIFFATGYLGLVTLMYVAQRGLMYFPETIRTAPAEAGLPQAEEVVLDTPDGARVIVWHIPPKGDRPV